MFRMPRFRLLLGSLCCLLLPLAPALRAGSVFTDPATSLLVRVSDDYGSGDPIFYDSSFTYGAGVATERRTYLRHGAG